MTKKSSCSKSKNIFIAGAQLQAAIDNWEKTCTETYESELKRKKQLERLLKDLRSQIDYLSSESLGTGKKRA